MSKPKKSSTEASPADTVEYHRLCAVADAYDREFAEKYADLPAGEVPAHFLAGRRSAREAASAHPLHGRRG